MRQLYAAHDVFVFPSPGEGFGLPALEAMAAGCLVVATDAGGLADFVGPETALVVPRSETARCTYGVPCDVSVATVDELAAALSLAQREWGTAAMERPRLEGARIARTFTWTASARTLASALATIARDALLKENAA
jgi:glycosyltransferase involved in cell wall biosynthesis